MDGFPKKNVFHEVKERLVQRFGSKHLLAILAYGTQISNKFLTDRYSDYDITVVFKDYPDRSLPPLPAHTNVTVLFWPDIKSCGVENFRLYNHGEFYIIVLAGAVELYGTNPFKKLVKKLPKRNILTSLKEQIFLHCAKLASIALEPNPAYRNRNINKYSFRIAQNFYFLSEQKVNYKEFIDKPYEDWVSIFTEGNAFPSRLLKYLRWLLKNCKTIAPNKVLEFAHQIKSETLKIYGKK